jgi:hypothetical protein
VLHFASIVLKKESYFRGSIQIDDGATASIFRLRMASWQELLPDAFQVYGAHFDNNQVYTAMGGIVVFVRLS